MLWVSTNGICSGGDGVILVDHRLTFISLVFSGS